MPFIPTPLLNSINLVNLSDLQIQLWGGLEAIEEWLKASDTGKSLPSTIEGLDLTWLNE